MEEIPLFRSRKIYCRNDRVEERNANQIGEKELELVTVREWEFFMETFPFDEVRQIKMVNEM